MNGLLLLFYCLEILAALLCGAEGQIQDRGALLTTQDSEDYSVDFTTAAAPVTVTVTPSGPASNLTTSNTPTSVPMPSSSHRTAPPSVPQGTTTASTTVGPYWWVYRKECLTLYLVSGGLIIACAVLLLSCLMLAWKVRRLSRRLKTVGGDADLVSNSEYWMGTARKDKSASEPEAKETSVLMAVLSTTQEVVGDGADEEEGKEVNVDGKMGEEKKKEPKVEV